MTINTATINDITWADLRAAGIDTDLAALTGTDPYGRVSWELIGADVKVVFGPSVDVDAPRDTDEADLGWDLAVYGIDSDFEGPDNDVWWVQDVQDHHDTAADALRAAAAWFAH